MRREPTEHGRRQERFRRLRELNGRLRPWVAEEAAATERALHRAELEMRANAVLRRRDYAFVLYPETELRAFCAQVL